MSGRMGGFRIIVVSGAPASETSHFLARIARELPEVEVAGVLCERPLRDRIPSSFFRDFARAAGDALLRFAQASGVNASRSQPLSDAALEDECRGREIKICFTTDHDSPESHKFVLTSRADLGVALGIRAESAAVLRLPRLGSIFPLLRSPEAGTPAPGVLVTVCRTADQTGSALTARSRCFHTDPFDTTVSLGLKSALVGVDLLVETLCDFAPGGSAEGVSAGPAPAASSSAPRPELNPRDTESRPFHGPRSRAAWKLALRSSAYLWLLPFRNWTRRLRKRFPLVILCHHLISDRPHPMGLSTDGFLEQLRYLKRHYRLVSLEEGLRLLASGSIGQPTAVLTFDDGYEDNFLTMRAVLRVEPAPVTMFVCSELIAKLQPFPHDLRDHREGFGPLTPAQLQRLAAEGMEIGSHTRTHFNCGSTDRAQLESEIAGSRRDLETLLGRPVKFFAFPWGKPANMSAPAVEIARRNYDHFVSAYGGVNFPGLLGCHLLRIGHPQNLWELELALQQLLERRPAGDHKLTSTPAAPGSENSVGAAANSNREIGTARETR